MKKRITVFCFILVVGLVLSGCALKQLVMSNEELIKDAIKNYVLNDLVLESDDSSYLFFDDDKDSTTTLPDKFAAKVEYTRGQMTREVTKVTVDKDAGVATAEVLVTIPGEVKLFYASGEYIGTKDATLSGKAIFTAEKVGDKWKIADIEMNLTTNESAPIISNVTLDPQPVLPGQQLKIFAEISGEKGDRFRVVARNRAGSVRTRLVDNGNPFRYDNAANDGIYSGWVEIRENAEPGLYKGGIKAVTWGSVRDISRDENGEFLVPVKITIKVFTVEVGEGE
ncbi:hypothetical protein BBF96_09880 [Anoxybacter fermentans]|uniref:Uncharacterized protein n=1 Tax=Anoxybacter fermentans TaxID=1323375 RepID=A0A3Q9HQY1_9FIRM|nr:hypothetical protein [Anoxybacter fermentans]AZR73667.1 hypothetical protein BBF96_09880 [Anoxybacter fermentans]